MHFDVPIPSLVASFLRFFEDSSTRSELLSSLVPPELRYPLSGFLEECVAFSRSASRSALPSPEVPRGVRCPPRDASRSALSSPEVPRGVHCPLPRCLEKCVIPFLRSSTVQSTLQHHKAMSFIHK